MTKALESNFSVLEKSIFLPLYLDQEADSKAFTDIFRAEHYMFLFFIFQRKAQKAWFSPLTTTYQKVYKINQ